MKLTRINPGADPRSVGPSPQAAMSWMVLAMLLLPGIDAIAKWLSGSVPPGQIAWSRFLFQSLLMLPLALATRGPWPIETLPIHAARGALIALATLLFFAGLRWLPIADAISIFFVEPLIVTVLSAVFLGETVGWRRLSAVVVGFAGALLIIRPSYSAFGWAALLPLGAAVAFALYIILTRRLARDEEPARMQFLSGIAGLAVMSIALGLGHGFSIPWVDPVWPEPFEWLLLFGLGAIATAGHLLVVHALRIVPATVLAPFQYLEIVSATILGWLLFRDLPDAQTGVGIAIIVGSGLYVFHRERVRHP